MVHPFHLLVADDDDGLRESVRVCLESQGYWVSAARSGEEAVAIARVHQVHCAILDYRIGDTTGIDLHRVLHAMQPQPASILISAELERSLRTLAAQAGIAECLAKPISLDVLRQTVAAVLRQRWSGPTPPLH